MLAALARVLDERGDLEPAVQWNAKPLLACRSPNPAWRAGRRKPWLAIRPKPKQAGQSSSFPKLRFQRSIHPRQAVPSARRIPDLRLACL